jgi:hypothetical protein
MTYRVLSLDGGGTWALIEVKALMELYPPTTLGRDVLKDFDLAAANSGGSIVLGALLENLSLDAIFGLFNDQTTRTSIFSPTHSFGDRVLHDLTALGPKYSAENKLPALQRALPKTGTTPLNAVTAGIRRLGSAEDLHVLIVGFDYDSNHATFFRSSAASGPAWGQGAATDTTLAEAIHASTNAPVNYFDAPATFPDRPGRYWDGAITGCNNPILAGVTEAVVKTKGARDIVGLSLGTGSVALPSAVPGAPSSPYLRQIVNASFVNDLRKLSTSILDDPPDVATYLAHVMTGSGLGAAVKAPADSQIVRMNPLISPVPNPRAAVPWSAPGSMTAAQFAYLANLDMDAIQQHEVDAISEYAHLWTTNIAPNQPIRMDSGTLQPELGQGKFSGAVKAWSAIK